MSYIIIGCLAFLFFIVYDINSVTANYRLLRCGFFAGCLLLLISTGGIVSSAIRGGLWYPFRTPVFLLAAFLFLILLLYTLFFAIPFQTTYINSTEPPKTCTAGFYALSRHPGVLWFIGFYLSLWLAWPGALLLTAGILFSLFNVAYIILQDRWIFMKTFPDYGEYKRTTPFLIPTCRSLKRCVETFRS